MWTSTFLFSRTKNPTVQLSGRPCRGLERHPPNLLCRRGRSAAARLVVPGRAGPRPRRLGAGDADRRVDLDAGNLRPGVPPLRQLHLCGEERGSEGGPDGHAARQR